MSTLREIGSQFGSRFNTWVCDVQLGGFKGRIRGYPNYGKKVVFIGDLAPLFGIMKDLPNGFQWLEGESRSVNIAYIHPNQHGSTVHRIRDTIFALKRNTGQFPVKISALFPAIFVYNRGTVYNGFHEGRKLEDVMSAIWLGTGPAVGNVYGTPFWREEANLVISDYKFKWEGEFNNDLAIVELSCMLLDSGKLELEFPNIKVQAGDKEYLPMAHHQGEIIISFLSGLGKCLTNQGFTFQSQVNCLRGTILLDQTPKKSSKSLIELLVESFLKANCKIISD